MKATGVSEEKIRHRMRELSEHNPMLGFRGCRLAIAFPEIAEMQARAIFEAAVAGCRGHRQGSDARESWCRWSSPAPSSTS